MYHYWQWYIQTGCRHKWISEISAVSRIHNNYKMQPYASLTNWEWFVPCWIHTHSAHVKSEVDNASTYRIIVLSYYTFVPQFTGQASLEIQFPWCRTVPAGHWHRGRHGCCRHHSVSIAAVHVCKQAGPQWSYSIPTGHSISGGGEKIWNGINLIFILGF